MTSATYQVTVAELAIGGMTCASCAARIEGKLNGLDGVSAAVNFATETARVTFPATVTAEDLVSAVERAGYTAVLSGERRDEPDEMARMPWRLLVSVCARLRRGGRDVPGGRRGGDRPDAARPLAGDAGQAAAGPAVAGRQGRRGAARRHRGPHPSGGRWPRSRATCSGRSATTRPPFRWPRSASSTREPDADRRGRDGFQLRVRGGE
jgi:P-type Cu+ transporter